MIMRKQAGSGSESEALSGMPFDWLHLVGAAYCDVFTCDRQVSEWLGDLRTRFGRRHQLAAKGHPGGPQGFVQDLMATWP